MNKIEELIQSEGVLLLDGAMGTMLMAAGLESGSSPEEWNVLYPERVRAVHRAYIAAGSRLVLTNSFGGNRVRLKRHDLQDDVFELNRLAAANARLEADAAQQPVLVAGSMGPTGELLKPLGPLTYEEAVSAFAEQAAGLEAGGADLLWVETMSDLNEVKAAITGARQSSTLPLAATLSFDTKGRTMMGVTPAKAAENLGQLDLLLIGANCGTGPDEMETIVAAMHQANPSALLIAKANAGMPHLVGGQVIYDGSPERMGVYAQRMRDLGVSLVGACCGSTPEHIAAMHQALQS